ncbi:MAG: EF-P lysine aminoacylase GenX [bacterium]|nr:EF-P lysine aminoacylase GenX [bacterium]
MLKESLKPNDLLRLEKQIPTLKLRSKIINQIRLFFIKNDYMEVETPIVVNSPAPEDFINAPTASNLFLRTSPELHMKRMVAAGYENIFQIGKCFREGEIGKLHNIEFTMLEWYQANGNYNDILNFLKNMLLETVYEIFGTYTIEYNKIKIDFSKPWEIISVAEAFAKYTGKTPSSAIKEDLFEILLTENIEPHLPKDRAVILIDYPAEMAALSKLHDKNPEIAERWELYLGGIEIANAYSELTDYTEQKSRFTEAHSNRKAQNLPAYPEDKDFFESLKYGMPNFCGCALGIDRLVMIMTNCVKINEIISFIENKK